VTKDDIDHVARLAMLRFDECERDALIADMAEVLGYISCLERLDAAADGSAGAGSPARREDSPERGLDAEKALGQAPEVREGQFRVPKIL
jgi:aspartyl-tRNA(Asn)/glutamyl-tRNA(Gln) amidotransferase subunit C